MTHVCQTGPKEFFKIAQTNTQECGITYEKCKEPGCIKSIITRQPHQMSSDGICQVCHPKKLCYHRWSSHFQDGHIYFLDPKDPRKCSQQRQCFDCQLIEQSGDSSAHHFDGGECTGCGYICLTNYPESETEYPNDVDLKK